MKDCKCVCLCSLQNLDYNDLASVLFVAIKQFNLVDYLVYCIIDG